MNQEKKSKKSPDEQTRESCDDACGPTREAGGTTGAGNLSEGSANRTGGATSGMPHASSAVPTNKVPPDA